MREYIQELFVSAWPVFVVVLLCVGLAFISTSPGCTTSKPRAYRDWHEVGPGTYARKTMIDGTTCILLTQDYRTELQCDWGNK